jgi:hypothetical protein
MRIIISTVFCFVTAWLSVAAALAQPAAAGWQPGPGAVQSNTYTGSVDAPAIGATLPAFGNFLVSGWFVDRTAEGWAGADNMQVWLGTMDGGGSILSKGVVALPRPDVASSLGNPYWSASGFVATVPGWLVPPGPQTLSVYLHTPGGGWWYQSISITSTATAATLPSTTPTVPASGPPIVVVNQPVEGETLNGRTGEPYVIEGIVSDPIGGPPAIDFVDIWIFGERDTPTGTDLGQATIASDGSWSLRFTATRFPSTHTNIFVYAHSKTTRLTTEIIRGFNISG